MIKASLRVTAAKTKLSSLIDFQVENADLLTTTLTDIDGNPRVVQAGDVALALSDGPDKRFGIFIKRKAGLWKYVNSSGTLKWERIGDTNKLEAALQELSSKIAKISEQSNIVSFTTVESTLLDGSTYIASTYKDEIAFTTDTAKLFKSDGTNWSETSYTRKEIEALISDGGKTYRGAYATLTRYEQGEIVSINGIYYIVNSGVIDATNTKSPQQVIDDKNVKQISDGVNKGTYSIGTAYRVGDIVRVGKAVYYVVEDISILNTSTIIELEKQYKVILISHKILTPYEYMQDLAEGEPITINYNTDGTINFMVYSINGETVHKHFVYIDGSLSELYFENHTVPKFKIYNQEYSKIKKILNYTDGKITSISYSEEA